MNWLRELTHHASVNSCTLTSFFLLRFTLETLFSFKQKMKHTHCHIERRTRSRTSSKLSCVGFSSLSTTTDGLKLITLRVLSWRASEVEQKCVIQLKIERSVCVFASIIEIVLHAWVFGQLFKFCSCSNMGYAWSCSNIVPKYTQPKWRKFLLIEPNCGI